MRAAWAVCTLVLVLGLAVCSDAHTAGERDPETAVRAQEILEELGVVAKTEGPSAAQLRAAAKSLPRRISVKSDEAALAEDSVDPRTGEALLEETARVRHAQRLEAERMQAEAYGKQQALAAEQARQQYVVGGHRMPLNLEDPCIALCDHDGGWRDYACQDCIFQGLVNGYVGRYQHFHTHLSGGRSYDYNAWAREYCLAAQHRSGGAVSFSKCFLDQIMTACNL